MTRFLLHERIGRTRHTHRPLRWHLRWLIPLLCLDALLAVLWIRREQADDEQIVEPAPPVEPGLLPSPRPAQLARARFPTDQNQLLNPAASNVFQATASGRPDSGLFGSVRTTQGAQGLVSRFHEGIDIAPLQRDARRRPVDKVHAVADGTVAYVNKHAGNSDYGKYVVLLHEDPVGHVYTLYGHLADLDPRCVAGRTVRLGERLGVMGNTALSPMPMERAHLHFEIGLLLNPHYTAWAARRKVKRAGGPYNGLNMFAINPLPFFAASQSGTFDFTSHLQATSPAFHLLLRIRSLPPFFLAYPRLWAGGPSSATAAVLAISESGLPVSGRPAGAEEESQLGKDKARVLSVDEAVLGRNGRHLISRKKDAWSLTPRGLEWLDVLTFQP